jgi:hypothetical protein
MSTVAIYSEGSSDTKVFNWLMLSEKVFIYDRFILPALQLIDPNQLNQIN